MSKAVKPRAAFWVVGIIFLLWNLMGCGAYLADMMMSDAAYADFYGENMIELRNAYPAWSVAAYAIGVWGGLLAALLMLMRKRLSVPLFIISLIGAVIGFLWVFITPEARAAGGSTFWVMPLVVTLIGLFEIWFSSRMRAKGVLT